MSTVSVIGPVTAAIASFVAIRPARAGYQHLLQGAARPRWHVLGSQLGPVIALAVVCYLAAAAATLSAYVLAGMPGRFEWVAAAEPLLVVCAMSVIGFAAGIAARTAAAPWLATITPFIVCVLMFASMAALAERGTDEAYLVSGFNAVSMEYWQDFSGRYLAFQAALFALAALTLAGVLSLEFTARGVPVAAVTAVSLTALAVSVGAAGAAGPMLRPAAVAVKECAGDPVPVCAWPEDASRLGEFAARANRIYAATPADLRPAEVLQWGLPAATGKTATGKDAGPATPGRFRSVPDDPGIAGAVATDQLFLAHGCAEAPPIPPDDVLRPILVALRVAGDEPTTAASAPRAMAATSTSSQLSAAGLSRSQGQTLREQIDRRCHQP